MSGLKITKTCKNSQAENKMKYLQNNKNFFQKFFCIKNKKGFVFTASIVFFVLTVLTFSIVLYNSIEENEKSLITDSSLTRIINFEDSVQQAIKRIFLNDFEIKLETNITEEYESLIISTNLANESKNSRKKLNNSLNELNKSINHFFPENNINITPLKLNPRIYTNSNLIITKSNLDYDNNLFENITLFFNESEDNEISLRNISITIISTDDYYDILNTTEEPSGEDFNLTIKAIDVDGRGEFPIREEINKTIPFNLTEDTYSWVINNSDNTTSFINITLDNKSISVIANYGFANISIEYKHDKINSSRIIYHPAKDIILTKIPNFNINKKGRFESILN